MVYLVHFSQPYRHARHYLGYTKDLEARMERHTKKRGSRLMLAVQEAGIITEVVRIWPDGTRDMERDLKRKKNIHRFCPICRTERSRRNSKAVLSI